MTAADVSVHHCTITYKDYKSQYWYVMMQLKQRYQWLASWRIVTYSRGMPESESMNFITKLPESSDLCGNITEFGVAEGHTLPCQTKWYCHTDLQIKVVLFYILLFNDFMSFPAKTYETNMYVLLLYLSVKIKV